MISLSRIYGDVTGIWDALRYGSVAAQPKPVVVWNLTRRCNLRCAHCYANAESDGDGQELTFDEGCRLLDDLAVFGVPAALFSGGEPLLYPHLYDLLRHAARRGLRTALSTNGTLLDRAAAQHLRDAGVAYVGISLDGLSDAHDRFRGATGTFAEALRGLRVVRDAGLRVGMRCVMMRANLTDIPGLLDLAWEENIPRMCFYHWVPAGRGKDSADAAPDAAVTRRVLDTLLAAARRAATAHHDQELLTVDNHADGPYVIGRLADENPEAAATALDLLRRNGGNGAGVRIACIGWDGMVYPDQFWRNRPLGNVRRQPFSAIWTMPNHPLLSRLRNRRPWLKGRCANCRWLDICNGNLRARAEAATGDPWAADPACYLTEEEISV